MSDMSGPDPARELLERLLDATLEARAFPLREAYLGRYPEDEDLLDRLIFRPLYVAEMRVYLNSRAKQPDFVRIAPTIRGVIETETPEARTEERGIAATLAKLQIAAGDDDFPECRTHLVPLQQYQERYSINADPGDFARWVTMICSPLLSGVTARDPQGFLGIFWARGWEDRTTGFFKNARLCPELVQFELPTRGRKRPFLLEEYGALRAEPDAAGRVRVFYGTDELVLLDDGLGARVLAVLVGARGKAFHVLDLQALAEKLVRAGGSAEYDRRAAVARLNTLDVDATGSEPDEWTSDHWDRLGAVLRRCDLLGDLARRNDAERLPRWAQNPAKGLDRLLNDLRGQLKTDPLAADFPPIKNAARGVSRALKGVLGKEPLVRHAGDFHGNELMKYAPKS